MTLESYSEFLDRVTKKDGFNLGEKTKKLYLKVYSRLEEKWGNIDSISVNDLIEKANTEIRIKNNKLFVFCIKKIIQYRGGKKQDFSKLEYDYIHTKSMMNDKFLKKKIIDRNKIKSILEGLESDGDLFGVCIFRVLYEGAERNMECMQLKRQDVNFETGEVKILHGKGDKERDVIFSKKTLEYLNQLVVLRDLSYTDELFTFYRKNKEKIKNQDQSLREFLHKVGMKYIGEHIHPHQFRHTGLTHMIEDGVELSFAQQYAGHSDIATTQIYSHISSKKTLESVSNKRKEL